MEEFDKFKDWFPHSDFCMAGGLNETLVAGQIRNEDPIFKLEIFCIIDKNILIE